MTVKPWSPPHGGSRTTASLVSQNPNIPSASTQQLPILPKPTINSRTPSSQVPNATAAIFFFFLLCYYSVRTNRQAQRIRSTAELGLLCLLFVLSTDSAAVFSVAILCILTINAMRRLAAAVDQLSNVVSREVPGILSSLRLSGVEINDLAKQLAALRRLKLRGLVVSVIGLPNLGCDHQYNVSHSLYYVDAKARLYFDNLI